MLKFEILSREEELVEFEKGVYDAFVNRAPDLWMAENYRTIDGCRLQAPFPYRDLVVYAAKYDGKIVAAAAAHFNTQTRMQLEMLGFTVDKTTQPICEGLLMYTAPETFLDLNFLKTGCDMTDFVHDDMRQRGMMFSYGTCRSSLEAMYSLFGFEVIDKIEGEGEPELLIRYDLRG